MDGMDIDFIAFNKMLDEDIDIKALNKTLDEVNIDFIAFNKSLDGNGYGQRCR